LEKRADYKTSKEGKKGNLTICGNWHGITLTSTTAKLMGKILIKRICLGVDNKLRVKQAGFRAGRGTTEQIFVLRNILEQAIEWNSNLYLCFVDFEKAFDSVHRETLF
jgi:sorting nexin-29